LGVHAQFQVLGALEGDLDFPLFEQSLAVVAEKYPYYP